MSNITKCPKCHGKLIYSHAILNKNNNEVLFKIYYCPSLRCKVKKVICDNGDNILNIEYYKNIDTKRKIIAKILKANWRKYSLKTKKKLYNKYILLRPLLRR